MAEDSDKKQEQRSGSQSMYFPKTLSEGASQGYPFIEFKITDRIDPQDVSIFLYQPLGFALSDGATYTNFDLGAIQGAQEFSKKVASAGGVGKAFNDSDTAALALVSKESIDSALGGTGILSSGTAVEALKKGIAVNPYTRVAFENVNIRTHEFSFKLVAEEESETEMAKKIERTFRKFLYPKRIGSIALQYPPMFQIRFYSNGRINPYMPNIKPCYLTGLTSTFNESTNAMFKKTGAPLEVSLSLSFQEERTMVRQDLYESDETFEERDGYYEA